ncbi:glycerophosphocholine cholinephosphodiesterase ENPP6-like [Uloborus diversus]|uniref:glycerophosphocholine cholinephosphodiesterase ENPP6-like n=1 Tax=Uloborus diversus TaxID=327109 RepID=UPI002409EFE8|nr:glycerophosphocholine cholinephosphodiesterase ENPP6-like [Uloborus diversus]
MNFSVVRFLLTLTVITCQIFSAAGVDRVPKLLYLAVDGCRWDYLREGHFPGFKKLSEKGSHAPYVTPVFPSTTYPNWYSLVTGLYAESHGFVQNMMYDSLYNDFFLSAPSETAIVPHWWNGAEPIWVTAEKNGLRTAVYWWDGCEVEIRGHKPTFCQKYEYVESEQTKEALLKVLDNFSRDEIQFAIVYYEPVDSKGHQFGPDSIERKRALHEIDFLLDMFLKELDERGLQDEVNIVVVSDHGMTLTEDSSVHLINLSGLMDVSDIEYMIYFGATSMLLPNKGKTDKVYKALKGIPGLNVFLKEEIPVHYHIKNNRHTLPIMLVADEGYYIQGLDIPVKSIPGGSLPTLGSHGYDPYKVTDMRSIFYAFGPGIRKNYTTPPLNIVDFYNVLCDLLGIHPLPNNGTRRNTNGMMIPEQLISPHLELSDLDSASLPPDQTPSTPLPSSGQILTSQFSLIICVCLVWVCIHRYVVDRR